MHLFRSMRAFYIEAILEMDAPLRHFSASEVQALRLEVSAPGARDAQYIDKWATVQSAPADKKLTKALDLDAKDISPDLMDRMIESFVDLVGDEVQNHYGQKNPAAAKAEILKKFEAQLKQDYMMQDRLAWILGSRMELNFTTGCVTPELRQLTVNDFGPKGVFPQGMAMVPSSAETLYKKFGMEPHDNSCLHNRIHLDILTSVLLPITQKMAPNACASALLGESGGAANFAKFNFNDVLQVAKDVCQLVFNSPDDTVVDDVTTYMKTVTGDYGGRFLRNVGVPTGTDLYFQPIPKFQSLTPKAEGTEFAYDASVMRTAVLIENSCPADKIPENVFWLHDQYLRTDECETIVIPEHAYRRVYNGETYVAFMVLEDILTDGSIYPINTPHGAWVTRQQFLNATANITQAYPELFGYLNHTNCYDYAPWGKYSMPDEERQALRKKLEEAGTETKDKSEQVRLLETNLEFFPDVFGYNRLTGEQEETRREQRESILSTVDNFGVNPRGISGRAPQFIPLMRLKHHNMQLYVPRKKDNKIAMNNSAYTPDLQTVTKSFFDRKGFSVTLGDFSFNNGAAKIDERIKLVSAGKISDSYAKDGFSLVALPCFPATATKEEEVNAYQDLCEGRFERKPYSDLVVEHFGPAHRQL